jgi:LmbE family N-acetylglucosaminyl deacetylase
LDATAVHKPVSDLRAILQQEGANVVTSYDRLGVYGHRDHVRVHQIAGAAVLGTACDLVEATIDRLTLRRLRHHLLERGLDPASWPRALVDSIGTDDSPGGGAGLLGVDVTAHLPQKMAAIAAHASQVVEAPTFMGLPPGVFHRLLDVEWFHPARTVDGRFAELVAPHLRSRIGSGPRTHETHNSVLAG